MKASNHTAVSWTWVSGIKFLIVTLVTLAGAVAQAAPIAVSNPSFESPSGSVLNGLLDPPNTNIGLWSVFRTGVLPQTLMDVSFEASDRATHGTNVAKMDFLVGAIASTTLSQTLAMEMQPKSVYTLTFDAGQVSGLNLLTGASASIIAGPTPVASMAGTELLAHLSSVGPLSPVSITFITGDTAPAGPLGVSFGMGGLVQALGAGMLVDNVRMDVVPALAPTVVSRKLHGAVEEYDIDLPVTGAAGVECRTGGPSGVHRLVVNFPTAITMPGPAVVTTGIGSVSNTTFPNSSQVIVDLTGVANRQVIQVTLFNVSDGVNTANITVPMAVLLGDVTAQGAVNSSDIGITKVRSGQATTTENFRSDVTANGAINSSDIATVKSNSGSALP